MIRGSTLQQMKEVNKELEELDGLPIFKRALPAFVRQKSVVKDPSYVNISQPNASMVKPLPSSSFKGSEPHSMMFKQPL